MKHAIITGATGFIGVHLAKELVKRGIEVTAICRKDSPGIARLPSGVSVVNCEMANYDKLPDLLNGTKPDVFYHLAWEGATGAGRADAALQVKNAEWTLAALKAAKEIGCNKFVATGTVYENFSEQMANSSVFRTPAFYILCKRHARDMSRQLALKLGIDFCWCTFCHPVGQYIKPEQLMAYAVKGVLEGNPPEFGPALDYFDVIAVEDLAVGLYLAGAKTLSQDYCYIGSGEARPLKDYLLQIPSILGADTPIHIGKKPDDGMRFDPVWFDCSVFAEDAGFVPQYSFEQAIKILKNSMEGL